VTLTENVPYFNTLDLLIEALVHFMVEVWLCETLCQRSPDMYSKLLDVSDGTAQHSDGSLLSFGNQTLHSSSRHAYISTLIDVPLFLSTDERTRHKKVTISHIVLSYIWSRLMKKCQKGCNHPEGKAT
jgi:hypothetical protein